MTTSFFNSLLAAVDPGGGGGGGGGDGLNFNILEKAQEVGLPYADQATGDEPGKAGFAYILSNLLEVAMLFGALALLLYLILGAFAWITASGDSSKIEKAREKILQAIVGMIVLSATLAIFKFVQNFLGIEAIIFTSP